MEIDQTRLERQKKAIGKWRDAGGIGAIEAVTGFGKTYLVVLTIQKMLEKNPDLQTIVIVPSLKLEKDWNDQVAIHGLTGVRVYVVNTYTINAPISFDISGKVYKCDMLVVDEAHHCLNTASKYFSSAFAITDYKWVLAVSATFEKDHKETLKDLGIPVVDSIGMAEARKNGYISDYEIYNVRCQLSDSEKEEYTKSNEITKKYFQIFDFNLSLMFACIGKDRDESTFDLMVPLLDENKEPVLDEFGNPKLVKKEVVATNKKWKQYVANKQLITTKEVTEKAIQLNLAIQKRKNILVNAEDKIAQALAMANLLGADYHIMIFCKSIAACNRMAKTLKNAVAYHSGLTDTQKAKAIALFENPMSGFNILCTVDALNEGYNVERVDCAIRVSFNSKSKVTIQQIGRTVRKDKNNPDKKALFINMFVDHYMGDDGIMTWSKDKKWLKDNLKGQHYEEVDSIHDIPLKGNTPRPSLKAEPDEETNFLF